MLTNIAQIFQSFSIILAALFAIYGFDAWRREHVGKRRIELAEEVLALFYQARDAIESIRSSFGFVGEGESRKPGPNERPEHKQALDSAYVLIERYNRHAELFAKIQAIRYRFMAQLGCKAANPFDDLGKIVNELISASNKMARLTTRPDWQLRDEEAAEKHHQELMKVYDVYYSGGEDDPISPRVEKVVSEIESTCREIIESQRTLFGLLNLPIPLKSLAIWRKIGRHDVKCQQ